MTKKGKIYSIAGVVVLGGIITLCCLCYPFRVLATFSAMMGALIFLSQKQGE